MNNFSKCFIANRDPDKRYQQKLFWKTEQIQVSDKKQGFLVGHSENCSRLS